ncbi:MAG TPA: septum formation initiator family protein [Gemmatimonadales bacterium]|nr:septum formation initiator family protein [Gemmatimonadales bacterium]
MTRARWLAIGVLAAALVFAAQGGEYSTLQWLELREREREERDSVAALARAIDSLERWARLVETDAAVQERLARELYGMIRPGEHVFILEPAEPRP